MPSIKSIGVNFKQYAMVAAGGLGLTGGRAPSGPLHAQIGISDPCNHKCVFCWDHPPDDRENADTAQRFGLDRPGVMPVEQFKGIVDDLYDMGTRRIDLTGRGEPLLNRSALDMICYAKGRGMQLQMVTNGSRLFEPIAKGLVAARTDRVHVSLNAGTPETYPHIHVTESPEDYLKVKKNLRVLSDCKIAAGSDLPYLSLSFVISSKNYFEIASMIEVAHEVGAQEAVFIHTVIHDGTPDLALNGGQYRELQASLPAAREKAAALGVQNNLGTFGTTIPPYMPSETVGPPVVPCYVGWYFTVILGNGSVLPCCQCAAPIGQVTNERRFAEVWASREYADVRTAARSLPEKSDRLETCECDNCQLRPRNVALHNFLHPLNRIQAGQEVQTFTSRDFLRKMQGHHEHPPS
ncbi:MAG TPA: radical SAM protein [Chloroflexota bacterium]|nr:radical SAM protein [Chloroflexota bacterium]